MVPQNLLEALKELRDTTSLGVTFIDERKNTSRIPYAELIEKARRFASGLRERGVEPGEPVILVMTIPESAIIAILGCLIAECPPAPVYPPQSLKALDNFLLFVAHVAERSGARFLVSDPQPFPLLAGLNGRLPQLRGIEKFERMSGNRLAAFPQHSPQVAFLQFTSGSTGNPKGVMVTHEGLAWNLWMIRTASHMDHGSCVVTWLPVYHDMGLIGTVLNAISLPCKLVVLPPLAFLRNPRLWLEAISEYGGTHTAAPNFAYGLCVKRVPSIAGLNLRTMTTFICGAEPVFARTMETFVNHYRDAGLNPLSMVPAYGLAEATLAATFTPYLRGIITDEVEVEALSDGFARACSRQNIQSSHIVSCGTPMQGLAVRVASEDGTTLEERKVGEIQIQGPTVTPGYIGDPESTAQSRTRDGWLRTGDLGYFANGELYVCGRIKDVIIIRGKNFYAHDIESVASEVSGVRVGNVVAFGVQKDRGESLVVIAETKEVERSREIAQEIRVSVASGIGITPDDVLVVPAATLPKTSSGKLRRAETRRLYSEEALQKGKLSDLQSTLKSGFSYIKNRLGI